MERIKEGRKRAKERLEQSKEKHSNEDKKINASLFADIRLTGRAFVV